MSRSSWLSSRLSIMTLCSRHTVSHHGPCNPKFTSMLEKDSFENCDDVGGMREKSMQNTSFPPGRSCCTARAGFLVCESVATFIGEASNSMLTADCAYISSALGGWNRCHSLTRPFEIHNNCAPDMLNRAILMVAEHSRFPASLWPGSCIQRLQSVSQWIAELFSCKSVSQMPAILSYK